MFQHFLSKVMMFTGSIRDLNPFMPSGFFYFNSLDRFIFYIRGV